MAEPILRPFPRTAALTESVLDAPARLGLGLRPALLGVLVLALVIAFGVSLALGSVSIPLQQIVTVLLGGEAERASWTNIILKFRLPKALTAALAGAALSVSGLMMQTLFRNPLASSDVLGINSGASLGVALVVLSAGTVGTTVLAGVGLAGDVSLVLASIVGAALTLGLILLIARQVENSLTLLILGLMIGQLTFALVSLLLYFSIPERIQAFVNWGFGSFNGVTWEQVPSLAVPILIGLGMALVLSKSLNALLLGETYARSVGMDTRRARLATITTTALLTGAVTAFCGPIAFIGIAVPHLCRSLFNASDHRALVPGVILMGATVALIAALIAEVPGSGLILPLNAIMALFGAPVVIWVILRQRNLQRAFAA